MTTKPEFKLPELPPLPATRKYKVGFGPGDIADMLSTKEVHTYAKEYGTLCYEAGLAAGRAEIREDIMGKYHQKVAALKQSLSQPDIVKKLQAQVDALLSLQEIQKTREGREERREQSLAQPAQEQFQDRVQPWMQACFGPEISADRLERNHRFFEESTELVQALGMPRHEAHDLVDYVYGRPIGEPIQEVGGVMVTLAALCLASDLDMHEAGEIELKRIWTKVEQIRAKQAAKPRGSALPIAQQPARAAVPEGLYTEAEVEAMLNAAPESGEG